MFFKLLFSSLHKTLIETYITHACYNVVLTRFSHTYYNIVLNLQSTLFTLEVTLDLFL